MNNPKGYVLAFIVPGGTDLGKYGVLGDGNRVLINFTAIKKAGITDQVKWGTCFWVKLNPKLMKVVIIDGKEEALYLVDDLIVFDKKLISPIREYPLSG